MTKYDTVIVIYIHFIFIHVHKKLRKVTENIIVLKINGGKAKKRGGVILYCFGLCFCGIHHVQFCQTACDAVSATASRGRRELDSLCDVSSDQNSNASSAASASALSQLLGDKHSSGL